MPPSLHAVAVVVLQIKTAWGIMSLHVHLASRPYKSSVKKTIFECLRARSGKWTFLTRSLWINSMPSRFLTTHYTSSMTSVWSKKTSKTSLIWTAVNHPRSPAIQTPKAISALLPVKKTWCKALIRATWSVRAPIGATWAAIGASAASMMIAR